MIDLGLLREHSARIKELILKKEPSFNIQALIELDSTVRELKTSTELLRKQKNDLAKMGSKGASEEIRAQSIEVGKKLKAQEEELKTAEVSLKELWASCPNVPSDDIPEGGKEANRVVKMFGEKPHFDFDPQHHVELNEKNKWFDFEAGAKMSGSHFIFYKSPAAKIMYALTRLMLKNNERHGFEITIPPYLVHEEALFNASNFPKFREQVYAVEKDNLYLIPTAEVSLTNLHANSILSLNELPLRYAAWTSCFRREAGGYGGHERGLIRIHQFEKVELYTLCTPEFSNQEQQVMLSCAEEILQKLGLHYRISLLAAQDCSFPSTKTYDIEVWLPGQKSYYEVSSVSNCSDFQARRAAIRYRTQADSKPNLIHTLNGSSLALPRLMVALMETYQEADGSINIPDSVLKELELW